MRRLMLSLIVVLQVTLVLAQNKDLVPEEFFTNRNLYPTGLSNIQWQGNTDFYTWQDGNNVLQGNVKNEKIDTLFKLADFNNQIVALGKSELKRLPAITWKDSQTLIFQIGTDFYSLTNGQLTLLYSLPETAANEDIADKTGYMAYTIDNNLFIASGKEHTSITNDQDKGIVNGQSVHRNEFGINKGTFWSPEGNKLAFYRMDESMVTDYPLVDVTARVAELINIKYPMAGMTSHHVTLGVYDLNTGKTIFLNTGEPKEQYLTNIAWSPDQQYIYIAVLNRDQNHLKLNQYDANTGNFIKTLFEETNERYVEPQNPMVFVPGNNNQFIWQSQRDGYNHLYLYNTNGQLITQLTSGNWVVKNMIGFNEPAKGIFYTSTQTSPVENHLYYVDLKTAKSQKLTFQKGNHNPRIRLDGKFFISTFNNLETPSITFLSDIKGKNTRTLHTSANPLADYSLGKTTIFTLKAEDGTDLYCRMIKPVGFDSTKKYPVFIYVYGGPHAQLVTDTWTSGGLFHHYMAQKGFIVFTMDNRGSANRGFAFESIIHRNIGKAEMADQMKGVEYLKSLPYIDSERIGVDGWSYGGFMSINLKLTYPEVFKIASAGGPVTDWKYYEIMYGERYMDTPEQNPEGYKASNLVERAKDLQGKLLIIHGGIDNTVVWQHSQDFLKACIDNQKQLDYFIYPTHEHNVSGIDRAHLFRKIANYHLGE